LKCEQLPGCGGGDYNARATFDQASGPFTCVRSASVMSKVFTWFRLLLGGLLLAAVVAWIVWTKQPGPVGPAVVGTWTTPLQPDGFATALHLRPDRTCRVRWLDRAGKDTKFAYPPREGRWWLEGGTLFVDASIEPSWYDFPWRTKNASVAWLFAVQEETLVFGPQTNTPVTLHRNADPPP
jgi:hypothetical protein